MTNLYSHYFRKILHNHLEFSPITGFSFGPDQFDPEPDQAAPVSFSASSSTIRLSAHISVFQAELVLPAGCPMDW